MLFTRTHPNTLMKTSIFLSIILISFFGNSQDLWEKWDTNYPVINIDTLISNETNYALSVENDTSQTQYYARMANYRLELTYLGEPRPINESSKKSMKNVYKLFGNREHLPIIDKIEYEYKFELNGSIYWLAAQAVLDSALKKELKKGKSAILYCLFLNEHTVDHTLHNSFLISEFRD